MARPMPLVRWLPVLGMAAFAGFSYWLLQANLPPPTLPPPRPISHTPDYFADNFTISMLDKTGVTQYRLAAQTMLHYEDDDNTDVTMPSMRAFSPGQPDVTAFSKRGVINADGSIIDLYDDARVLRDAGPSDPPMRAESQHFRVFANDDVVQTEKPVKLLRGQSISTANGMIYNNTTREMRLLGQVRGMLAASETSGAGPYK